MEGSIKNAAMKLPSITLAVFAYNQEKFVRETVLSVLAQDYDGLEIIFSDDGSTDQTFEIIKEAVEDYKGPHRIVLNQNQPNLGLGLHYQKVYEMASGDWVVSTAGDDICMPDRCKRLADVVMKSSPDLVGVASAWIDIGEDGDILQEPSGPTKWLNNRKKWADCAGYAACKEALVHGTHLLPGCSSMWRRSLVVDWPPLTSDVVFEDVTLSCRAHLCGTLTIIDDQLIQYRQHSGAVVNSKSKVESFRDVKGHFLSEIEKEKKRLVCYRMFNEDVAWAQANGLNASDDDSLNKIQNFYQTRLRQCEWWGFSWMKRVFVSFGMSSHKFPFKDRGLARVKRVFSPIIFRWLKVRLGK